MLDISDLFNVEDSTSKTVAALSRPFLSMNADRGMETSSARALLSRYVAEELPQYKEEFRKDLDCVCKNSGDGQTEAETHFDQKLLMCNAGASYDGMADKVQADLNKLSLMADYGYLKCHAQWPEHVYEGCAKISKKVFDHAKVSRKENCVMQCTRYGVLQALEKFVAKYSSENEILDPDTGKGVKTQGIFEVKDGQNVDVEPKEISANLFVMLRDVYEWRSTLLHNHLAMAILNSATLLYGKLESKFGLANHKGDHRNQAKALDDFLKLSREIVEDAKKYTRNTDLRFTLTTGGKMVPAYESIDDILTALGKRATGLPQEQRRAEFQKMSKIEEAYENIKRGIDSNAGLTMFQWRNIEKNASFLYGSNVGIIVANHLLTAAREAGHPGPKFMFAYLAVTPKLEERPEIALQSARVMYTLASECGKVAMQKQVKQRISQLLKYLRSKIPSNFDKDVEIKLLEMLVKDFSKP